MNKFEKIMAATDADAVLIFTEVACNYVSRFFTTDGFVAVSRKKSALYTDARYIEAAQNTVKDCSVELLTDKKEQILSFLKYVGAKKVAVETKMTFAEVQWLIDNFSDYEIVADKNVDKCIEKMREVKSADEIESLKIAQSITEKAFDHILGFIKPGVTDIEIAAELEYVMRKNGAHGLSFETISVTGSDTSMPHGVPHGRVVTSGDFITMDYGALYNAMHADMTRTVAVGQITDEQKKIYDTVLKAQLNCLENLKAGITGKCADRFARQVIEDAGYGEYFSHSTGHSVGYEIHEGPSLNKKTDAVLQEGNCVTVEPGIYIPGKYGVRIEDMALITNNGCEVLTKADKHLIIL